MRKTKKIYLTSGNDQGLAWQLSVNVSAQKPCWAGSFYMAETTKLHSQKTVHIAGGAVNGREWQLSLSISEKQEQWVGNFYFK